MSNLGAESLVDSWFDVSNGSGADWGEANGDAFGVVSQDPWSFEGNTFEEEDQGEALALSYPADALASESLPPGALMSAKIPPAFDGRISWT